MSGLTLKKDLTQKPHHFAAVLQSLCPAHGGLETTFPTPSVKPYPKSHLKKRLLSQGSSCDHREDKASPASSAELAASVILTGKGSLQRRTWETADHPHTNGGPQEESLSPNTQSSLLLHDQTGETAPGTSFQTPSPHTSPSQAGLSPLSL